MTEAQEKKPAGKGRGRGGNRPKPTEEAKAERP